MPKTFIVQPPMGSDVLVGGRGDGRSKVFVGRLAESGPNRKVYLDVDKEFVVLVLGKRGSGKSYMLGSLVEGLAASGNPSAIAEYDGSCQRPAVLLLDPLMTFWTTAVPAAQHGPSKVRDAYLHLADWGMSPESVQCRLWLPAGFRAETDYPGIQNFSIRGRDLDAGDWADLCSVNLIREPQGILLGECWYAVAEEGYDGPHGRVDPNPNYEAADLVAYLDSLAEVGGHDHSRDTVRALRRTLHGYSRLPLFAGHGTPITDLLQPGTVSILMLPLRIGHDLRRVITRMLIRRILREREVASHIQQRLNIETFDENQTAELRSQLAQLPPRTILAIDEAQELLGDEGGEARMALEDYCLQGRNYGLSLILATQRPTTAAISSKVRSQVDTYFIHRLLTDDDIAIVQRNLLCGVPEEVRDGHNVLKFPGIIRALDVGQCLVTASQVKDGSQHSTPRSFLMTVRPRVCVHGGEVE